LRTIANLKLATAILSLSLAFSSCEKEKIDNGYGENYRHNTSGEVFFKIGRRGEEFTFNDIALYDSSAYILYFKSNHSEFTGISEVLADEFYFLDNGQTIYSGSFVPAYSNSIPAGPMIMTPSMYGDYALRIEVWQSNGPDVRNTPWLTGILKKHNLLHPGISCSADFLKAESDHLSFGFTVTNHDQDDLLILDINKTGPGLFHYFTNGLYLRDKDRKEIFSSTINHESPEPWNAWKPEWLSVLKSGESVSFNVNYPLVSPVPAGEYDLSFEFPGLAYQVSKEDLYQGDSRIWLGDVNIQGKITLP